MTSERIQRQIERLLDQAEAAIAGGDWLTARMHANSALALDDASADALAYLAAADKALLTLTVATGGATEPAPRPEAPTPPQAPQPSSFVNGRYQVKHFLGEGGKKRVYLAHDSTLDRDVAFALIKTEGLDETARQRITNEAQAMGRLGDHPNIVTVFDVGQVEDGQPYMVLPLMAGGDVEGLIEKAEEHKLPLELALRIGLEACQGLEFAHEKGVIHRDLKPGNVWLTADPAATRRGSARGVAKIGDFGLAVTADKSRLTQAGMMVGTVSYMPPEQAVGGEVTTRSDLYSLGAMLYEMVCGRPPFVGDESVAIISQHLNTPPVAPSWHRPDVPAGLEALILRLLEKDPQKRPASAQEVHEALAAIDLRSGRAPGTLAPAGAAENPLYQGTFVGREAELNQLREAFDACVSGQGALTMVVGEPGIGKTALCEQLATYVFVRGGRTLVGHCYEEGSLSLPYLAFVEALRTYVLARDPEGLKSDLGSGGPEVARIVSEIRERLEVEPRPAGGDPEEERWRLLQAVSTFLRNAASVQPLLIVLEDLHWADRGTLDLLVHVARNLEGARLLVVGTYRDVEVDRAHPLSATLAELRRTGSLPRVLLRGLTVDEVHRMYSSLRGHEVAWAQAEAVHRQTEGNPLFVQEVLRYLVEEGYVVREGGQWVLAEGTQPGMGIPEGLRDVIGRRLSHLSDQTNQVLSIAAVIGREFRLDVLQRVAGLPEAEVEASVKEAGERAIVEQRPAVGVLNFRFTHAFFRQTLYEEIFASQRLRLHQQVARGLEAVYARRLDDHASELAEHFAQSTDPADLEKALHYSELAAQRAMSVFAYGEAVRHLEQSLKIQEVLDPDDKLKRCDLLLALGEAMLPMAEPLRVADTVAEEAFRLAEALGDSPRAARAALQAIEAYIRADSGYQLRRRPAYAEWVARADRHAQEGTAERIYADLSQGRHANAMNDPALAHTHYRRAMARAFDLNDAAAFFAAAGDVLGSMSSLMDQELAQRVVREVVIRPRNGVRPREQSRGLNPASYILLGLGDRQAAEAAWSEVRQVADRTRDASLGLAALTGPIILALLDGRLLEALKLHEVRRTRTQELGIAAGALQRPPLFLGRAEAFLDQFADPGRGPQANRAVLLAHLGRQDEVRAIRATFGDVGSEHDESGLHNLVNLLEACTLIGDEETTRSLMRRLAPLSGRGYFGVPTMGVSFGRLLGDGARLLGQPAEARAYYDQGLEYCANIRFRPETALIRLDLAELLLEHTLTPALSQGEREQERAAAIEHLDFSIAEFTEMKMQPSLERALRHRGLLKA